MTPNIDKKPIVSQNNTTIVAVATKYIALFFLLCFAPKLSFAQTFNPLISFSVESCTLDAALEKLFAEYELNIAFSKAELSKIHIEPYSCSYKSVEDVLKDLLKGTDYGYKKIGKQYVIRKNQIVVQQQEPDSQESATEHPPVAPEVVEAHDEHKIDTMWNKTADTVRVFDTLLKVRTVMRYDTVVRVERVVETDTVFEVKYRGFEIKWPSFRDKGWFVAPSLTKSVMQLDFEDRVKADSSSISIAPTTAFAMGVDGGYKTERFSVGLALAYRSASYRFSLEQLVYEGDYYVSDTLDTYYVVHPVTGDTAYHHILDSTYVPLETTRYSYRDINRVDYLSFGVFATFDFWKRQHFRMFAKAGASVDFLLASTGSHNIPDQPFHAEITTAQTEPTRLSYHAGLGAAFKIVNRLELTPEVAFRKQVGKVYRADFPFDLQMRYWDFRLGLIYYF